MTIPSMSHVFGYDWFSWNLPSFEKHLSHLKGIPCNALEIGCHEGRASTWLLEHVLTHPDSRLTALDLHLQPTYWDNVKASGGLGKTNLLINPSRTTLRGLPFAHYDFVYIDGSHWTIDVLEDAVLSFRLAKVGAVIAFDDYLWDQPEFNQEGAPKEAIDAFLWIYRKKIAVLELDHQVWIRKLSD